MSLRIQEGLLWWSMTFMVIFIFGWAYLIGMVPLPPATWTSAEVAAFYSENQSQIRWGAAVCSWTAGFWLPFTVVMGLQIARLEKGTPILGILQIVAGSIQSLFLVLPPIFWGAAAFAPDRLPDVTAALHQVGNLMLVTTDQYYIYQWLPWIIISLMNKEDPHSLFPRWFGYFCIWTALLYEAGAIGFVTKTGLFAWDGLFVFYIPFFFLFVTLLIMYPRLIKTIRLQRKEEALETA